MTRATIMRQAADGSNRTYGYMDRPNAADCIVSYDILEDNRYIILSSSELALVLIHRTRSCRILNYFHRICCHNVRSDDAPRWYVMFRLRTI